MRITICLNENDGLIDIINADTKEIIQFSHELEGRSIENVEFVNGGCINLVIQ